MAFWEDMAKGGAEGLLKGVGTFAKDLRVAITGEDPLNAEQRVRLAEMANALEAKALEVEAAGMAGQVEINKIEAADPSLFKSGWRPAVGWVCCFGLGYQLLLRPLLPWFLDACGLQVQPLPAIELEALGTLLAGMLGLGGFRMVEKIKGATR